MTMPTNTQPSIHVGCSGWAYPSWKPDFYPAKTPAKQFLKAYAAQLNSVEVNYTFRALPTAAQAQSWLAAVGEDFCFSFKAPQRITHLLRLRGCAEAAARFATALEPFAEANRLGIVLLQLPPNFRADAARLEAFLQEISGTPLRLAFEFRHESWFTPEIYRHLERHQAALCIAESDELVTPEVRTAPFACYRLRKSGYSPADLDRLAAHFAAQSREGEVFAYFKHEDAPDGPLRARAVLAKLREL
jgi:uncharacterized protein YecE (DUF72 family)